MKFTVLCTTFLGALALGAQDDAGEVRQRAQDARIDCKALLIGTMDGIESVGVAGAGDDYRILVVVRDNATWLAARGKLGGDKYKGFRVMWTVKESSSEGSNAYYAPPAPRAPSAPAPAPEPAREPQRPTVAAPQNPAWAPTHRQGGRWEDQVPDCDIVREQLGLKRRHRPVGGGSWKSWIPCQIRQRSVLGAGGGHTYLYTSHRPGCQFQNGLISPIYRGSFLWPFELRASDSAWYSQVAGDLYNQFYRPPPMRPKPPAYYPPVATGQ